MTSLMRPRAGAVEDLELDERRLARSPIARRPIEAVAGDDPGDVRAVAVVVVRRLTSVDEVDEAADARGAGAIGQIVERRRHAGIDYRDADPGSVVAHLLPDGRRADGGAGALHRADDDAVERHPRPPGHSDRRRSTARRWGNGGRRLVGQRQAADEGGRRPASPQRDDGRDGARVRREVATRPATARRAAGLAWRSESSFSWP